MRHFSTVIPDVDLLLELEPEELGAKLLFFLRGGFDQTGRAPRQFHPNNLISELWTPGHDGQTPYPRSKERLVNLALGEAWAWLTAQGLIVPAGGIGDSSGWSCLSRRAQSFEDESAFADYSLARLLPRDRLHARIRTTVWKAYVRGEYDVAVFQSMKAVEVATREAAGLTSDDIGVDLVRNAFHPERGALTDEKAEGGERQARSDLFAGAIGSYKNPHSHRDVDVDDPIEALETVMLANHLLRIVDARKSALEEREGA